VHDARMHPDMRHLMLHHHRCVLLSAVRVLSDSRSTDAKGRTLDLLHSYDFDQVFGERATDNHVYGGTVAPLVAASCRGGFSTCIM
jgi:hypothetical protein